MTYPNPSDLHTEAEVLAVRASLPAKVENGDPIQAYKHALSCRLRKIRERKSSPITREQIMKLIAEAPENCPDCGRLMQFWTTGVYPSLDHIHPLSKGGDSHELNLRIVCNSCNSKKGNRVR